jgi:hypothetical protein
MIFATVDQLVRRNLLERQLPIHYYFERLLHVSSGIRILTRDTLKIINTVELPVNSYMAVDLPDDFSDDVALCIPVGAELHPVPKRDSLTPLRIHDSTGAFTPYADDINQEGVTVFGFNTNWLWFWNINDYGEPTGRYFGAHGSGKLNGYTVVKERRQIQLTGTFTSPTIVLQYISDGQRSDNATQIEIDAYDVLTAYADWKSSPNALFETSPEARTFFNQKRLCRARTNDLTVTDLRNIVLKAYNASIKN